MQFEQRQNIYHRISEKGLIANLIQAVREERPTASRNTIHLAFMLGGTTPTRSMILRLAAKILEQAEMESTATVEHAS